MTAKKKQLKSGQYPAKLWTELRTRYESGEFTSLNAMFQNYTKLGKICPTLRAIKAKSKKERWVAGKKKQAEAIVEATHEKFRRLAAEIGMDDRYILDRIKEMVDDKEHKNNGLQRLYDITGIRAPHKIARTDTDGSDVPDRVVILPANGFEAEK